MREGTKLWIAILLCGFLMAIFVFCSFAFILKTKLVILTTRIHFKLQHNNISPPQTSYVMSITTQNSNVALGCASLFGRVLGEQLDDFEPLFGS